MDGLAARFSAAARQPWFELAQGAPVYYPPAFFWWWYAYDAYAPSVFIEGALYRGIGGFHRRRGRHHLVDLKGARGEERRDYGSGRWATRRKSTAPGLLSPDGVILGCHAGTICAMTDRNTFYALHREIG